MASATTVFLTADPEASVACLRHRQEAVDDNHRQYVGRRLLCVVVVMGLRETTPVKRSVAQSDESGMGRDESAAARPSGR
ncbi:MAG: hypothetical protein ACOYMC_06160, partial [Pirellulales bacterium]